MLGLGRRLDGDNSPFVSTSAKRFYKGNLTSINPRNWRWWWYAFYHRIYEVVPYTKRPHFVMWSHKTMIEMEEAIFKELEKEYVWRILSPTHPHSVRVSLIFNDIIEALKCTVRDEAELDVGKKAKRHYVHKFEREVMVVDNPEVNACCIPTGKIVVFTGMLEYFKTDAEIATMVAHEVGHVVAHHSNEMFYLFCSIITEKRISEHLSKLLFSHRHILEADYIGLLLMASAGYDPRVAPTFYEKLGFIFGESEMTNYFLSHPSGKKRSRLLAQAYVMEEALTLYNETMAKRRIEGIRERQSLYNIISVSLPWVIYDFMSS